MGNQKMRKIGNGESGNGGCNEIKNSTRSALFASFIYVIGS